MGTDGDEGDGQGDGARGGEDPPLGWDSVRIGLEPTIDDIIGDGPGNEGGRSHPQEDSPDEDEDDAGYGCAQDFPYADLLGLLFDHEGDESQEAEAGDEDGDDAEGANESGELTFAFVQALDGFVQESEFEGELGCEFFPGFLEEGQGFTDTLACDTHTHVFVFV